MITIRRAEEIDLIDYTKFCYKHFLEQKEDNIYSPLSDQDFPSQEKMIQRFRESWKKSTFDIGWSRSWLAETNGLIVGDLSLTDEGLFSNRHRCRLGMGVLGNFRHLGVGTKLMANAIEWAKKENLSWIDLNVFSHNEKALSLYENFSFKEVGEIKDCFRVKGQIVDDKIMTLRL